MQINKVLTGIKSLFALLVLVASFGVSTESKASGGNEGGAFNPGDMIFHHIGDSHEWHFATIGEHHYSIPLPVILYSPENGIEMFSSAEFHGSHGDDNVTAEAADLMKTEAGAAAIADPAALEGEQPESEDGHAVVSAIYNGYGLDSHDKVVALDGHKFYDISITKNVASLMLSAIILFAVFFTVAGSYKKNKGKAPKGMQSFFEPIILFVRDDVAKPSIGPKYERFMPFLLTVFFFIWFNNLLGLLPGGANLTGNIATTMVLAVFVFIITNVSANKAYWGHIFNMPGVPWWLKTIVPIMPIVEFLGLFTKPFSLMIRLFANITAGHIIILSLLSLIFIFESYAVGVASTIFSTAMYFLELFVAILQAYVFALLAALYFGSAVAEHEHHDDHAHADAHH